MKKFVVIKDKNGEVTISGEEMTASSKNAEISVELVGGADTVKEDTSEDEHKKKIDQVIEKNKQPKSNK